MPTHPSSELERLLPGRVATDVHERSMYARDLWPLSTVRFREGKATRPPAAVVRPATVEDVRAALRWCNEAGVTVLPYGGGSGVCGGVLVDPADLDGREAVVLDLKSLAGVEDVSERDLTCTALAGTLGMDYEQTLNARGLTGGHYPQSMHASTLGGWLACRSAGQASTGYGKAEDLVAGMDVVLASGDLVALRPQPSSAAGPDLARLFCGSEGTLGVIVRATMRVFRVPAGRVFRAFRFDGFARGADAVRAVVQSGLRPAVLRLYDEADTSLAFPDETGCVLVCIFESGLVEAEADASAAVLVEGGAQDLGPALAERWMQRRFHAAYQLATVLHPDGILGPHVIADTMEVAGSWSGLDRLYTSVREALSGPCLAVLAHLSHVYTDGACLYFTFALQGAGSPDAEARYEAAWGAGMRACLDAGGTITHHHGVGRLKARWLREELGEAGWSVLASIKRTLDPEGILNPGNLGLRR